VAFSRDGRTVAVGGMLWDLSDSRHPRKLDATEALWHSVTFMPDGRTLVAGSTGSVQIGEVPDRQHPLTLRTLETGPSDTEDVAASPRDGIVAMVPGHRHLDASRPANADPGESAGPAGWAGLWDLSNRADPRQLATLAGHTDVAGAVTFNSDGTLLATGGAGNIGQLWDVADAGNPRQVATLTGHTRPVTAVAFTPDGRTLITGSADHTIRLWDTNPDRVADRICALAPPPITQAEWDRYLPGLPHQQPCP
jgi:WD40 repeat protein